MELKITVTAQQLEYLRELLRGGLWGPDIQAVATELVMSGLRDAARHRFVTLNSK